MISEKLSISVVRFLRTLSKSMLTYLRLQLFLTLCSWPILLHWGLPLSYASILGNLIFTPFLTLYLFLSSLLFFSELLHIPNGTVCLLLESLTTVWLFFLDFGKRSWLFFCPLTSPFLVILLPFLAACILMNKKWHAPFKSIGALSLIIISSIAFFKLTVVTIQEKKSIPCFDKSITLIQKGTAGLIYDPGCMGRRISAPSWVSYTLIPLLTKQGITTLTVICEKPSVTTFRALTTLIESFTAPTLYLPFWTLSKKNSGWFAWAELLTAAQRSKTSIIRIDTKKTITLGNQTILLESQKEPLLKNGFRSYPLIATFEKKPNSLHEQTL